MSGRIPGGLSAVLIAKDEEKNLPAALESVKGIADEIIVVVDDRTKDKTAEIARAAGAKAVLRRFDGFGTQKQAALDLATKEWVLSLDADERVEPALREEILARLDGSAAPDGFNITRRVFFLGYEMHFSGLGGEKSLRLFRRDKGRFDAASIHERVIVNGAVGHLRRPMTHEPYHYFSDYLDKMIVYSDMEARKKFDLGQRFYPWHNLLPVWEFFKRFVLKAGFLDGQAGFLWAGLSAFHAWAKYLRLWEIHRRGAKAPSS